MEEQNPRHGLWEKPAFGELATYIVDDPDKIKYPDNKWTDLRNGFIFSQFDGLVSSAGGTFGDESDQQVQDAKIHAAMYSMGNSAAPYEPPAAPPPAPS